MRSAVRRVSLVVRDGSRRGHRAVRQHPRVVWLTAALATLVVLVICFAGGSPAAAPPAPAVQRAMLQQAVRPLEADLIEMARGPRSFDASTVDAHHMHGRVGVDEKGIPLWVPEALNFRMTPEQKAEAHQGYCFNRRVSKSLPLDREVVDYNSEQCKSAVYDIAHFPKADVVIVFHNEDLSVLLRSVHSILNRTPPELLGEIILFNDASNATSHTWLYDELPLNVKYLPKTRLIAGSKRRGLMMARVDATTMGGANSDVTVYLDSHIECAPRWLEPMLDEIHKNPKTIVTPMIHTIGADTFDFEKGALGVISFSWTLGQTHPNIKDSVFEPAVSPVMAGGLFAANRKWFIEDLGGYDPEMQLYGGEEMEIGFKTWMCGGQLLNIPCSRIGHVFRTDKFWKGQVYKVPMEVIARNKRRAALAWLDEFYEIYDLVSSPLPANMTVGDISMVTAIREKLQCKPFKWFVDNIATDVWVPDLTKARKGALFARPGTVSGDKPDKNDPLSKGPKYCLDNMQVEQAGIIGLYQCHGLNGSQTFLLDNSMLRVGSGGFKNCVTVRDEDGKKNQLYSSPCQWVQDWMKSNKDHRRWTYEVITTNEDELVQIPYRQNLTADSPLPRKAPLGRMVYSRPSEPLSAGLCLSSRNSEAPMQPCDPEDPHQLWGWSR